MKKNGSLSYYVAGIIALVYVLTRVMLPPHNILSYDVFGYYLYLPALFIHHDSGLHNIDWISQINAIYQNTPTLYQIADTGTGNWVIRFNCGISVMYMPFFLIGHLVAYLTPYPEDGFSLPYQWAIIVGGIFYSLIGIWAMRKVLLQIFDEKTTASTLVLLFLGTSVFFFSTMGNKVPHVFLFTLIAFLMLFTIRWHQKPSWKLAAGIGLLLGIISISRTTGILAASIPVLWGITGVSTLKDKILLFARNYRDVLFAAVIFIIALLPQLLYWKIYTGEFIYNAYDDPQSGFDFLNPRFWEVLFGFRKGFFLYSPMMIFAVAGLFFMIKYYRTAVFPVIAYALASIYLIASYSTLVSYGWRAFIELHAPLAIPLGFFVQYLFKAKKWLLYGFSIVFIILISINLLKSYQTLYEVVDGSRMTKEYYFATFFKTSVTEKDKELLLVERSEETIENFKNKGDYSARTLVAYDFETVPDDKRDQYDSGIVKDGKWSMKLDSMHVWSSAFRIPYKEITARDHAWIHVRADIYPTHESDLEKTFLVTCFKYNKRTYKYRGHSFKDLNIAAPLNQWTTISYDYLTPEVRTVDDLLEVHVWYTGKHRVYIDNLVVDAYEKKD